jgi:di/tricarboxylate transporter
MQNTRLSTLFDRLGDRIVTLFRNPWRRIALVAISFLFGFFLGGSALTSTAGQLAFWDVPAAGLIVLVTEAISRFIYRQSRSGQEMTRVSLFADVVNALKIGMTYGLFLEAFKLNS